MALFLHCVGGGPTKDTPTLERIIQAIAQWNRSDKELLVILRAMLEAEEDEQAADEQTLK